MDMIEMQDEINKIRRLNPNGKLPEEYANYLIELREELTIRLRRKYQLCKSKEFLANFEREMLEETQKDQLIIEGKNN